MAEVGGIVSCDFCCKAELIAESLSYRQHEILYRVMEEAGLDEQKFRPEVLEGGSRPGAKPDSQPEEQDI